MYKRFTDFINSEDLIDVPGKILLGISGGLDSMVMLSLFQKSGYEIAVAHCNFGLRGQESDTDQFFVAEHCKQNNLPFHSKLFETKNYAREHGISLQMAARDLRYSWFGQLTDENMYSQIAVAHNKNDLAETFLINLIRGTGIRGMTGIGAKTGRIMRPLLFASRKEILDYAIAHELKFREDSSNIETKYKRNRIRHRIIPEFEAISPGFVDTLYETSKRIKDIESIYTGTVTKKLDEICDITSLGYQIRIDSLLSLSPLPPYMFELLRRWDFPGELVPDIISSLTGPSGKQFFSPSHRLVKDRDYLIITPADTDPPGRFYIEEGQTAITRPVEMIITSTPKDAGFVIPARPEVACLDLDLLHFPLILRKWQKGDYFQPLGMNGLKKLSDFFIDEKFSIIEKERTWILASGNKVVWVAGHRIDNRFRITGRTRNILTLEILQR
jgi:tRNA(Ile)-lysidine synthase